MRRGPAGERVVATACVRAAATISTCRCSRNFRLNERFRLQFRFERYNALNHVQLDNPNTKPSNTAFGAITAENGHGQRQITMALKLIF
jgi:hypothetical protein